MRRRDFVLFAIICLFLLYTLVQEGSISFEKSFFFEQVASSHRINNNNNHHRTNEMRRMNRNLSPPSQQQQQQQQQMNTLSPPPKPIISDLDQDGYQEMLTVSDRVENQQSSQLKLIRLRILAQSSSVIHPKFFTVLSWNGDQSSQSPVIGGDRLFDLSKWISSSTETTNDKNKKSKKDDKNSKNKESEDVIEKNKKFVPHIVGLGVGFIDHPRDKLDRKQIVILVLSNWRVLCLDHELKHLWNVDLNTERQSLGYPSEVVISVTPYRVQKNDKGMVVIGLRHRFYDERFMASYDARVSEEQDVRELAEHYSYYAFSANDGQMRWKHESQDFHYHHEDETLHSQHNHKLDAMHHLEHSGEVSWSAYRSDVIRQMPHIFRHDHDTSFSIEHFNATSSKRLFEPIIRNTEKYYGTFGKKIKEAMKIAATSTSVKKSSISAPNVLVAHLSKGIEVIHLYTGRTLCQLASLHEDAAFADLNGDGVLEEIEENGCLGTIQTGVPSLVEPVFQANICKLRNGGIQQFYLGLLESEPSNELMSEDEQFESVAPSVVEFYSGSKVKREAVFFVESGLVTVVTPDTNQNYKIKWQSMTPSKFNKRHEKSDEWYFAETKPYALRKNQQHKYILAVGESFITVLDLHGAIQQVIPLPEPTIEPVLVNYDVNGDGMNDLIITTRKGMYAFRARSRTGVSIISVLVIGLLILVSIMYLSTTIDLRDPNYVKKSKDT